MANITRQIWRYAPLGAAFAVLALGTAGMLLARETLAPAPDQTQAQVQAEASMPYRPRRAWRNSSWNAR